MKINMDYKNRYDQGETIWDIVKTEHSNYKDVFQGIFGKKFLVKYLPNDEIKDICNKYIEGMSTVKIGEIYGVKFPAILRILESNNIERRSRTQCYRKYSVNQNYFDDIDTPNKAYILGFLYADGNVSKNGSTINLTLQECDKEILEKIKDELDYTGDLRYSDNSKRVGSNGYISKNTYSLLVNCKHMHEQLIDKGVVPRKSLILEFPNWLSSDLLPHFLRGYMDGDGCIVKQNYQATITSTEKFCLSIQEMLKNKLGINSSIKHASCNNNVTKVLVLSRRAYVKTFLDYIYKDADLYMERKHNIYKDKYCNS